MLLRVALVFGMLACTGCLPGLKVVKSPGPKDTGIRYYRPKPYLLVVPVEERTVAGTGDKQTTQYKPGVRYVDIRLEYLPDFAEEYSLHVRTGLGTNETQITLDKGWNLTQINQKLDSNFDDNVKAIAELVKSAQGFVKTGEGGEQAPRVNAVPAATNIPLGYYEAVVTQGPDCVKRLYGWRYVGFHPYATCPVDGVGSAVVCCDTPGLYGIVFENGVMTFKALGTIQADADDGTPPTPYIETTTAVAPPPTVAPMTDGDAEKKIEAKLLTALWDTVSSASTSVTTHGAVKKVQIELTSHEELDDAKKASIEKLISRIVTASGLQGTPMISVSYQTTSE